MGRTLCSCLMYPPKPVKRENGQQTQRRITILQKQCPGSAFPYYPAVGTAPGRRREQIWPPLAEAAPQIWYNRWLRLTAGRGRTQLEGMRLKPFKKVYLAFEHTFLFLSESLWWLLPKVISTEKMCLKGRNR